MRKSLITLAALPLLVIGSAAFADHHEGSGDVIAKAMAAAPAAITHDATIMDYDGTVLREGTNGWTCLSAAEGDAADPGEAMCGDAVWTEAMLAKGGADGGVAPTGIGVSYMLAGDNPHLMIFVPEAGGLDGLNSEPGDGKAWVMWGDRAGRHIMVPIGLTSGDEGDDAEE